MLDLLCSRFQEHPHLHVAVQYSIWFDHPKIHDAVERAKPRLHGLRCIQDQKEGKLLLQDGALLFKPKYAKKYARTLSQSQILSLSWELGVEEEEPDTDAAPVTLPYKKFGATHPIQLQVTSYLNGNLAIQMVTWESGDPEPWATLTVNLPGQRQKDHAFIDTNADSEFPTWLIRHGLAIPTGRTMQSGFCTYPEYRFRANRLQELDPEGYAGYLKNFERRCSASHANQLRYADTKNRTKTITLYMFIAMILMGLLAYLIYSLKIIYSIAWSLEEVVTELVVPMVLICVILNIAISIFWGSGLLLSDTNIDSMLALPIPLRTLILSKLTVLFMVEVALTVALLLPMMVLFGLTAGMGFPFYLIVLGITILFPVIPGLLGTMFGTQIYRILKNSSARIARLKAAAAILILFAFMIFMFCKFPDIAAGNFGDVISTSTFTLYAGQYIHRLLNGDYLLIGIYFGGVFLIGVTLLYGLIKIFRNWYSNDAIQGSKSQPVDWNKQTTKQHSPVSALLERERTRYFSLPVYLKRTNGVKLNLNWMWIC